jgi:hypothetical protein
MVLPDSHRISRVPWYLGNELEAGSAFTYGAVTLYRPTFQMIRLTDRFVTSRPLRGGAMLAPATPPEKRPRAITLRRFGLIPFRSPLLGESLLLSFPGGTEMVHFPSFASRLLWIQRRTPGHDSGLVSPFGDPRVEACLRLTGAYRSLPRPSSPLCAKASTVRP